MTQDEINEWNKNKPTHDESQMGYGRGDYEAAKEASEKVKTIQMHTLVVPVGLMKTKGMIVGSKDNKKHKKQ